MADPATKAYSRTSLPGALRTHQPAALVVPTYDLAPDIGYVNKFAMWSTLRDCYDGEATIKNQGELYLPKLSAHGPTEYGTYRQRSYFYNAVRRTHRGLMGSLFRKPVEVTLPPKLKSRINLQRITQDAKSFDSFCRTMGHEVLLTGRFGILADFKETYWQSPYLAGYLAENIYAYRTREHKDREIVDRVILLENEVMPTEFGYERKLLIRVLRLDPDTESPGELLYSQTEIRPDNMSTTSGQDTIAQPLTKNIPVRGRAGRKLRYIPFVFVNSTNLSPEISSASLEDIAVINISHYQSTAHLEHGRFYAGMPTYVTAGSGSNNIPGLPEGMANPNPMTVGPSNVWELEEGAKAWLLEFTGHGLTFLENAVDSKQLQMQSLGGRLISSTRRAAAMSDEAWQLLETGDEATLMDVAVTADEAMTLSLAYLGDIMGEVEDVLDSGILVEFNKEFVRSELTARELRALQALAERGHIPTEIMYYALREVGVVPVEYTLDDFNVLMSKKSNLWEDPHPVIPPTGAPGQPGVRPQPKPRPANNGGADGQGDT